MMLQSRCVAWPRRQPDPCVSREFEGCRLRLSTVTIADERVGELELWVLLAPRQRAHGGRVWLCWRAHKGVLHTQSTSEWVVFAAGTGCCRVCGCKNCRISSGGLDRFMGCRLCST